MLLNLFKRGHSTVPKSFKCTLIPGDGIGKEISQSVVSIFDVAKVPVKWDIFDNIFKSNISNSLNSPNFCIISDEVLSSIRRNHIALKGPLTTPIGKGHKSLNITLRKELKLFSNVRPCTTIKGLATKHKNVDIIIFRENTEGEYSGLEHEIYPGVVESLKIITESASTRISEYAFKYAKENGRRKVTVVHKANIMKKSDGLFLKCAEAVSKRYKDIVFEEMQIDKASLEMVRTPSIFDVMLMPNLYGDIISDLSAGLIGGLGLTPSGNIGKNVAIFESVHGSAPDIANKNIANPTALILSSIMLLRHIGLTNKANIIQKAIYEVLQQKKYLTKDLGGNTTTTKYTESICEKIKKMNDKDLKL